MQKCKIPQTSCRHLNNVPIVVSIPGQLQHLSRLGLSFFVARRRRVIFPREIGGGGVEHVHPEREGPQQDPTDERELQNDPDHATEAKLQQAEVTTDLAQVNQPEEAHDDPHRV